MFICWVANGVSSCALEQEELEREIEAKYGLCSQRYDLRKRRARDYSHLFLTEGEGEEDDMEVPYVENGGSWRRRRHTFGHPTDEHEKG
jgi:hypothetical protein